MRCRTSEVDDMVQDGFASNGANRTQITKAQTSQTLALTSQLPATMLDANIQKLNEFIKSADLSNSRYR
jgi:hypothetical protein